MKIWSAWLQGRDKAPPLSRAIFALWEEMNPGLSLHVVEEEEARAVLASLGVERDGVSPQVVANFVRLDSLAREGGVWTDATVLPTMPLDRWLTPELTDPGFFAFRCPGPQTPLSSWFLYAAPGDPLISGWRDLYADYWRTPRRWPSWKRALYHGRPLDYLRFAAARRRGDRSWSVDPARGRANPFYPYHVLHYNFGWLLETDPALKARWQAMPHRHAMPPHLLQRACEVSDPDSFRSSLPDLLKVSPVHKLNGRDPLFGEAAALVRAAFSAGRTGAEAVPAGGGA